MKLECKAYKGMCELAVFKINYIEADESDFGDHFDRVPRPKTSSVCKNMKFISKLPTLEVLEKYKITVDEYKQVCKKLDEELSFGACYFCNLGW